MKFTHEDAGYSYAICDFCETDETGRGIGLVHALGEKGICDRCLHQLQDLLAVTKASTPAPGGVK